jgi:small GTP-binding protein
MPASAKQKPAGEDGARPLKQLKLLLVGQPDVGKTSLVRRLLDDTFDPKQHATDGLERRAWDLEAMGRDVRVHVWDFGGQEIWHATHQLFLTKRSLYVLVVDARLDDAEARIAYWMKLIESFGPGSPVLVVQNKTDQRPNRLAEDSLRRKHALIQGFHDTSCKTGDGIPELRRAIEAQIDGIALAREPMPATWHAVKRKLESKRSPVLKRADLDQICDEHGVADADEKDRLVETLRDVGTLVSFHDTWLRDTKVLDPAWITTGVYAIVSRALQPDRRGIVEADDLARVLSPAVYAPDDRRFLVDMMLSFKLMFPLDGSPSRWLLPGLLPEDPVDVGPFDGAVVFLYTYSVLFDAVVSQLLARMYVRIASGTASRRGAVLNKDGCRARILADREDRTIEIRVEGPTSAARCEFLAEIRSHLEQIQHMLYPSIPATPHVVWSDGKGHSARFPYKDLLTKEDLGMEWDIAPGTEIRVRVRDVLALVRPDPPPPAPEPATGDSSRRGAFFLAILPLALLLGAAFAVKITDGKSSLPYLGTAGLMTAVSVVGFLLYEKRVNQKAGLAVLRDLGKAFTFGRGKSRSPAHGPDEGAVPSLDHLKNPKLLASDTKASSKATMTRGQR